MWSPILANLRSILFDNVGVVLPSVPELFRTAHNCKFVSIETGTLGSAEEPALLDGSSCAAARST